jgi:hypothetical protein
MNTRAPYAVQTVQRGTVVSGFDVTVGLVILFLLTVALLPIW